MPRKEIVRDAVAETFQSFMTVGNLNFFKPLQGWKVYIIAGTTFLRQQQEQLLTGLNGENGHLTVRSWKLLLLLLLSLVHHGFRCG